MKRYLVIVAALAFFLSNCFVSGILSAQEQEEVEYVWGTVSSISSKQIIITEYDYDTEQEVDVAYTLDPNVKLENVKSWEEIAVSNDVWVDYVVKKDKKIAVGIEVEKPSYEESVPLETSGESGYYEEEIEY